MLTGFNPVKNSQLVIIFDLGIGLGEDGINFHLC